jgi:hypothetical protein
MAGKHALQAALDAARALGVEQDSAPRRWTVADTPSRGV